MEAPPDEGPFLALAVSCVRCLPFDLWHIGVLYRSSDGSPLRLLEMLGDQWLRDVDASGDEVGLTARYAWAVLPLPSGDATRALAHCAQVGQWVRRCGPAVRLGFFYDGGTFDEATGGWTPVTGEEGLYCASTVLSLFLGVGIELVDRARWPHRDEMDAWVDGFAERLRHDREMDRWRIVRGERGCVVFHPRALMGVCLAGRVGLSAEEATALEPEVEAQYWELRPRAAW